MDLLVLGLILAIVGVLTGWLAPMVVHSRRPYGLGGDIVAATAVVVIGGFLEHLWLLPWFEDQVWDMPAWMTWATVIGEPLAFALIVLWLMRKMRPAMPVPAATPAPTPAPAPTEAPAGDTGGDA